MNWFSKSEQIVYTDLHISNKKYFNDICNFLSEVIFLFVHYLQISLNLKNILCTYYTCIKLISKTFIHLFYVYF